MLETAARAAHASGLKNISFREMDAEQLPFAAGTFDVVVNTYGLMFCPDPLRALSEARRVLTGGGRAAVVVWDSPEKSPYFSTITAVAVRQLGFQAPQAGGPGPFRFADPIELASLMQTAGFTDVRVESCQSTFVCASADEYCRMFGDLAWKTRLSALAPDERSRFIAEVADAARRYSSQGRLRLVATSLCAYGRT
jgi:enediyne biosynthesis protein CalE5